MEVRKHMNRFAPALLLATLSACAGRWESVPITDHRLQRSGAAIELAVGGRRERLRNNRLSATAVRDGCRADRPRGERRGDSHGADCDRDES